MLRRRREPEWADWPNDQLLDLRICDLDLRIEGTWLEEPLHELHKELSAQGLRLRPHVWLSDEWFVEDKVPGIAIPFFLAHPTLVRLERRQMLEVEGGTPESCLRILRHEMGHVLQQAYALHRRRRWQLLFGASRAPYPEFYRPKPASRDYVLHFDMWYAQSHPDEDFAETFAVWLGQSGRWRKSYEGWPALAKLDYVDDLVRELRRARPLVQSRATPESIDGLQKTLRWYYAEKRRRFEVTYPAEIYDADLRKLFIEAPESYDRELAGAFLRRNQGQIRRLVARWTAQHRYTMRQVFKDMLVRCDKLQLRVVGPARQVKLDFAILLAVKTMDFLYTGRHAHPL